MSPRRAHNAAIIAIALCSLLLSTCKEELPAYHRPGALFSARIRPLYGLTAAENKLHVFVVVKNMFDETLEGAISVTGQVQLVSTADPGVIKTFPVNSANVTAANWHYAGPGKVAIDPRDTIVFDIAWDLSQRPLLDDAGNDLTEGLLHLGSDPQCPDGRKKSDPRDFLIQASVEIFDRTGPAVANNVVYRFCLISNWVNPRDCPYVAAPCNVVLSGGD